jgi:HAD superfamily hydrolase (TIGR01509 family)
MEGAVRATPLPGVAAFLSHLASLGVRRAVMTRNSRKAADLTLSRCGLEFEHIVTRDDGPIKPNPWAIHEICRRWEVAPREILVCGDFHFDLEAGRAAGSTTLLVCNGKPFSSIPGHELADLHLSSFTEADELTRLFQTCGKQIN